MSNATLYKYQRLYGINRHFNDELDAWIDANYSVTVGNKCWNYGIETFRDSAGKFFLDTAVMQAYVRAGGKFYATPIDWCYGKLSQGVRNVPKY